MSEATYDGEIVVKIPDALNKSTVQSKRENIQKLFSQERLTLLLQRKILDAMVETLSFRSLGASRSILLVAVAEYFEKEKDWQDAVQAMIAAATESTKNSNFQAMVDQHRTLMVK